MEINRVLKEGGKATINLIYSLPPKNEADFKKVLEALGFQIIDEYSGQVDGGAHYRSTLMTVEKIRDINFDLSQSAKILGKEMLGGLKFAKGNFSPRDTRHIINSFKIDGEDHQVEFNEEDRQVINEESSILDEGKHLKERWKKIKAIPKDAITERGFVRFFDGDKYILLKSLKTVRAWQL